MGTHTDTHNWTVFKVRTLGVLTPKWDVFINPTPPYMGLKDLCGRGGRKINWKSQRWWMTPRKQHLPDTTGLMHIWTHRVLGDRHRFKSDRVPALRGRSRHELRPLIKKLSAIKTADKGKIPFFLHVEYFFYLESLESFGKTQLIPELCKVIYFHLKNPFSTLKSHWVY